MWFLMGLETWQQENGGNVNYHSSRNRGTDKFLAHGEPDDQMTLLHVQDWASAC